MSAVVDFPVKPEARPYLDAFGSAKRDEPEWFGRERQRALSRFAELGFPSRKSENWRYIDLQSLQQKPLLPAGTGSGAQEAARAQLAGLQLPQSAARLVLLNGHFSPELSRVGGLPNGVWFGAAHRAIAEREDLFRELADEAPEDTTHPFAALNAAFFGDGFVLNIDAGVTLDEPLEIVHLAAGGKPAAYHTRSLVRLGEGSRATILETYAGEGRYWRNDVIAVHLGKSAELTRAALIEEAGEAVHLAELNATLGADARFSGFVVLLGGATVRQEANVRIAGEGAQCRLDGAFVVGRSDEANIVTNVDHRVPRGETRELIKGVAAARAHGAFQGKITVAKHAQKVDAHQLSRNLILGGRAVIDTKPELEIYADDVKCSHGASVGELDETALFYLKSRGIPEAEARHMLIEGFLREPVEEIADPVLRDYLLRRLARRLEGLEE
ncbi:MAG: Fe-S cluster assembly protein SufD [Alphaproteobacteria bacterium]|nr:Fe-S cluster assembly protein SufD [Alphaproteobacteria bacterium]